MTGGFRTAWYRLTAARRPVIVPPDGTPLSDDETGDLITAMRAFHDDAGTRRVAPLERQTEKALRAHQPPRLAP